MDEEGVDGPWKMNFVFKGIGAVPTYTNFVATQLQHCNYVNNSNQGCV